MEHVELAFDLTRRSLLPLFFRVSFAWGCVIRSHAVKNFLQVELVVGVAAKFHRIIKNIFRYAHELALPNGRTEEKKNIGFGVLVENWSCSIFNCISFNDRYNDVLHVGWCGSSHLYCFDSHQFTVIYAGIAKTKQQFNRMKLPNEWWIRTA